MLSEYQAANLTLPKMYYKPDARYYASKNPKSNPLETGKITVASSEIDDL